MEADNIRMGLKVLAINKKVKIKYSARSKNLKLIHEMGYIKVWSIGYLLTAVSQR